MAGRKHKKQKAKAKIGWEERMRRARQLHRPSLSDWECDGLYETFGEFANELIGGGDNNDYYGASHAGPSSGGSANPRDYEVFVLDETNTPVVAPQVPVLLDAQTLSPQTFWDEYEGKEIPCVIRGIPYGHDGGKATEPWPAVTKWPLEMLEHDDTLRNRKFKCGEDDDGRSIKVKLKHFLRYTRTNKDDSPLYIFDTAFDEDKYADRILKDYTVPIYFQDDLFRFISEQRRAPYRWFLVGPERSGTTVHIDPLATNAWNTLIEGKKRWVLFPPNVPKRVVKGKGLVGDEEDDEAIHYFMYILPRIKRQATEAWLQHQRMLSMYPNTPSVAEQWKSSPYHNFVCYEFTQHAGETVFVPNGWNHAVLNLTDTVGVTQNFCSERNFDSVWLKTRKGRPKLAWKWLQQLDSHPQYQHLAVRAKKMNEEDNFIMRYDPVQVALRQQRRQQLQERSNKQQKQQPNEEKQNGSHNSKEGEEGDTDEDDSSSDEGGGRSMGLGCLDRRRKHRRKM